MTGLTDPEKQGLTFDRHGNNHSVWWRHLSGGGRYFQERWSVPPSHRSLPRNLITKSPPDPNPVPLPSCNSSAPSPIRPSPICPETYHRHQRRRIQLLLFSPKIGLVFSPLRADPKEQGARYSLLFLCDCVFRPLSRVAVRKSNELSPTKVPGLRHQRVRRPRQRKYSHRWPISLQQCGQGAVTGAHVD